MSEHATLKVLWCLDSQQHFQVVNVHQLCNHELRHPGTHMIDGMLEWRKGGVDDDLGDRCWEAIKYCLFAGRVGMRFARHHTPTWPDEWKESTMKLR